LSEKDFSYSDYWKFPHVNWIKINTDGAARGCLGSFSMCRYFSW